MQDFKACDNAGLLNQIGNSIWADIQSKEAVKHPKLLNRFILVTFADLKNHKFFYWFGFPVLKNLKFSHDPSTVKTIKESFSSTQITSLYQSYVAWKSEQKDNDGGFFTCKLSGDEFTIDSLSSFHKEGKDEVVFGFVDPCPLAKNPGWPLRNFVALIYATWRITSFKALCLRSLQNSQKVDSLFLSIKVLQNDSFKIDSNTQEFTGWEPNAKGDMGPRLVDLGSVMDPMKLVDSSVDLNIRLMRWRMLPSLEVDKISKTKCLLFGAGTLGCNVASLLLGWGIKHITFIDNGKVSYSNPVRQILYEFSDCVTSKNKATAAAERVQRIYPGATASGHVLSIPMPGHAINDSEREGVLADVSKLRDLIRQHDVVYLLTDTRESRWLPTLLCAAYDKLLINAALGFDSYLVMRHGGGAKPDNEKVELSEKRLGCYFCSDVVAPANSVLDRTLDQQCTVTRPGLAPIASALAVELMISLLHHPLVHHAPADSSVPVNEPVSQDLGILPHCVRGFLSHFQNLILQGYAFEHCTACSLPILNAYKENPDKFVLDAINVPNFLERVSGLEKMKFQMDNSSWDVDEDIEDL